MAVECLKYSFSIFFFFGPVEFKSTHSSRLTINDTDRHNLCFCQWIFKAISVNVNN